MPYILQEDRFDLDSKEREPENAGELNYRMTQAFIKEPAQDVPDILRKLANQYLENHGLRYQHVNDLIGAMTCALLEYQRRTQKDDLDVLVKYTILELYQEIAVPYEDKKIEENGDVY